MNYPDITIEKVSSDTTTLYFGETVVMVLDHIRGQATILRGGRIQRRFPLDISLETFNMEVARTVNRVKAIRNYKRIRDKD